MNSNYGEGRAFNHDNLMFFPRIFFQLSAALLNHHKYGIRDGKNMRIFDLLSSRTFRGSESIILTSMEKFDWPIGHSAIEVVLRGEFDEP